MASPGLIICEQSEGYATRQPDDSCTAYWDNLGCVWTCGYGSTGTDVVPSTHWTREAAQNRLMSGWMVAQAGVLRASPVLGAAANANRLDAITDFAYNEGVGRYQASSMKSYVNRQDWTSASGEFPKWNLAGGKVQNGLVTRRAKERALFLTPVSAVQSGQDSQTSAVSQPSLGTLLLAFFHSLIGR